MKDSSRTQNEFNSVIKQCEDVFLAKMKDYGSSWRMLRPSSLTDQIFIKAKRIRSIEEKGTRQVEEGIRPEFAGIINYSIIALIQLHLGDSANMNIGIGEAASLYSRFSGEALDLMLRKNHDYGEAWRDMRVSSLTDIILTKLMRIRQIEDNMGRTFVSEGVDANYYDIINYAVFALIKMDYENS